jgi:hypothetical protein
VLLELRVGAAGDLSLVVEDEAGRPGRPLVDGEDHLALGALAFTPPTLSEAPRPPPLEEGSGSRRVQRRLAKDAHRRIEAFRHGMLRALKRETEIRGAGAVILPIAIYR